jgi:SAM-dependent methyltransferase
MTDSSAMMEVLLDVHSGLPRQGPGDDESTLRALGMCTELPAQPAVLDIGCGPGMQTMALAGATDGTVTAIDLIEQFLDQLRERAIAAGVRHRVQVMGADMADLPFGKHTFDLIWCEGAAYIMGISEAFTNWMEFLRPHGYLVVSEICWLMPEADVPADVVDFWRRDYAGITDIAGNIERIEACGYDVIGHFTLPDESWWTHYYDPLAAKLRAARETYGSDPRALEFIDGSEEEQRIRREHGDTYGYEFFVCRLRDPDAPRARGEAVEPATDEAPPLDQPIAPEPEAPEELPRPEYPPPLD